MPYSTDTVRFGVTGANRTVSLQYAAAGQTLTVQQPITALPSSVSAKPNHFYTQTLDDGTPVYVEYARGVDPSHDIQFDKATNTVTGDIWNWQAERGRPGIARYDAVPVGNKRTVTGADPAARWQNMKAALDAFQNGTGDWIVTLPGGGTTILMDSNYEFRACDQTRRLYIVNATLPTADTMFASYAAMKTWHEANGTIILGPANQGLPSLFQWLVGSSARVTWNGVTIRPQHAITTSSLMYFMPPGPNTPAVLASLIQEQVLEQVWVDGQIADSIADNAPDYTSVNQRRGITLNGITRVAMLELWVTDIVARGEGEASAIGLPVAASFIYARNLYLESASEEFIWHGSDQPNTDPFWLNHDGVLINACGVKKDRWCSNPTGIELKNHYESKGCIRWSNFNLVGIRMFPAGQDEETILQAVVNGNNNYINTIRDVAFINYVSWRAPEGFVFLSRNGSGAQYYTPSREMRFVYSNVFMFDANYYNNNKAYVVNMGGDIDGLIFDGVTVVCGNGYVGAFFTSKDDSGSGVRGSHAPRNIILRNIVAPLGQYGIHVTTTPWGAALPGGFGKTALSAYVGGKLGYRGLLFYNATNDAGAGCPSGAIGTGASFVANLAATGIDTTTCQQSGASLTAGDGGGPAGADPAVYAAMRTNMPWARIEVANVR